MTENLYLILHKVRSEPAFDIGSRIECQNCKGDGTPCMGCDGHGHWWIIPTSGHRAYPSWWKSLDQLGVVMLPDTNFAWGMDNINGTVQGLIPMPYEERDHYAASEPRAAPTVPRRVPATATEDFIV